MEDVAAAWDKVYSAGGKYAGEDPLPFIKRIIIALERTGHTKAKGLYVGCGNGRNFLPLLDAGLKLEGLDISHIALDQVLEKKPNAELLHGNFLEFDEQEKYGYIIAIQVFQHGDAKQAEEYFKVCAKLLKPHGLLFVRVRSVDMPIDEEYEKVEQLDDGSFSIRYHTGSKQGLIAHYFSRDELKNVARFGFEQAGNIEEVKRPHDAPKTGQKVHFEAVYRKL